MARGWESKAVESQIESAEERAFAPRLAKSEEEIRIERERESIELSRNRILNDLASSTHAGYQQILGRSLKFLDEKLAALNPSPGRPDLPE
jgi:hypothetical protein